MSQPQSLIVDWIELEARAREASRSAYCPYSRFPVGAAVADSDGRIFTGCNVENASYGLSLCAERNAIFQAISAGSTALVAIAIYTSTPQFATSCGACRQVMMQFGPECRVRSICDSSDVFEATVRDLLPHPFILAQEDRSAPKYKSSATDSLRLCIDLDNVVSQTDYVLRLAINQFTQGRVNLSYENITQFDYFQCCDASGNTISKDEWDHVHSNVFCRPDYQSLILPIDGAVSAIKSLSNNFSIHIATARPSNLRESTAAWLSDYGLGDFDLHFLRQGEKHHSLGSFFASVEDNLEQAIAFAEAGVSASYVLSHPWNSTPSTHSNLYRFSSWDEIAADLLRRVQ